MKDGNLPVELDFTEEFLKHVKAVCLYFKERNKPGNESPKVTISPFSAYGAPMRARKTPQRGPSSQLFKVDPDATSSTSKLSSGREKTEASKSRSRKTTEAAAESSLQPQASTTRISKTPPSEPVATHENTQVSFVQPPETKLSAAV